MESKNPVPSSGSDLALGLTEKVGFGGTTPESLGMGRNEDNGKPTGPDKSSAAGGHKFG